MFDTDTDLHNMVSPKGTLEQAFEDIKSLAEESGAPKGIEMIQARDKDKVILFAMPGTIERIQNGEFPPSKPERITDEEVTPETE